MRQELIDLFFGLAEQNAGGDSRTIAFTDHFAESRHCTGSNPLATSGMLLDEILVAFLGKESTT